MSKPVVLSSLGLAALWKMYAIYRSRSKSMAEELPSQPRAKAEKVKIDKAFLRQLVYLVRQVIPSKTSKEVGLMAALMATLLARTGMSLFIAHNMGMSVEFMCKRMWRDSARNCLEFAGGTVVASLLNAALKFLTSSLATSLRERFVKRVHDEYMKRNNYYRINKLGTSKLQQVDQLITDDIMKWCKTFADVYSSIFKPVVDFFLFSLQMSRMMGWQGPAGMYTWFLIASYISSVTLPPYAKLAAKEQQLEGQFREAHCSLINNSEMVAFMGGEAPERTALDKRATSIFVHHRAANWLKFYSNIIMGYVNKYFSSVVGFVLLVRPLYVNAPTMKNMDSGSIAKYYVASRHVMENLSSAVLALFEVQKKIGRFAGLTSRVYSLMEKLNTSDDMFTEFIGLSNVSGKHPPQFIDSKDLRFEHVSVFRPDGALLAKDLNFAVPHGRKVIITGGNGCGKSSLFRVLRGLWPLVEGTIHRPNDADIYFLSQVNFVPEGSLRHLLTYPHSEETLRQRCVSDDDLKSCLAWAHLSGFEVQGMKPELDTVLDWDVALSPGQKQRMAFARLLYHQPRYAVLDECTNGISPDVEEDLYRRCDMMGISVFSISHKVELKRLHDFELHYVGDRQGSYEWIDLRRKTGSK